MEETILPINFSIEMTESIQINMLFKDSQVKVNKVCRINSNTNSFKKNTKEEKVITQLHQVDLKLLHHHSKDHIELLLIQEVLDLAKVIMLNITKMKQCNLWISTSQLKVA